jgi:serine/threonine protein kinase
VVAVSVVVEKEAFGGELSIGRELDGRFTVLEKLSEGGMGAVYRAHQRSVDREVAIKVVRLDLTENPEAIKLFLREARLTSKLNHPNAVAVLDFGQTADGVFYLAMELVKGRPLDQVLREEGAFTSARVVRIGMQVCDALEAAHVMQIVHRDLKPANIMLVESRRDFVKVLDFGLAKTADVQRDLVFSDHELRQIPADQAHLTTMLGTPAFLPPERTLGGTFDARSDLYSLGCVLYLLASGRLPFEAETPRELVIAHTQQRPAVLTCVPPNIAHVIDRLLSKDPAGRYQSASETRDALEEAALHDNVPSYQSSPSIEQARLSGRMSAPMQVAFAPVPSVETPPPPKRKRAALFAGAGVLLLGAIVIVALTMRSGDSGVETAPSTAPTQPSPPPVASDRADPPRPEIAPPVTVPPEPVEQKIEQKAEKPDKPVVVRKPPRTRVPKTPPPVTKTTPTSDKPKLPF